MALATVYKSHITHLNLRTYWLWSLNSHSTKCKETKTGPKNLQLFIGQQKGEKVKILFL